MALVTFKVYAANGSTEVYTLPGVFQANYPHVGKKYIEHESPRGKGSIIVDAGEEAWDLTIKGVFFAATYKDLMTLVDAIESTVVLNTAYYVKIASTSATTYSYKVKRITPIIYQDDSLRTNFIEYTITFRVNTW